MPQGAMPSVAMLTAGLGGRHWEGAAERVALQAERTGWFAEVHVWNQQRLKIQEPDYWRWSDPLPRRGFRLWSWKPVIIHRTLRELLSRKGPSLLLYLDAGFELNDSAFARQTFQSYLDRASRKGAFIMTSGHPEQAYMKPALAETLGLSSEQLQSDQFQAGLQIWSVSQRSLDVIAAWRRYVEWNGGELLLDGMEGVGERPSAFIAHRHDQAILSGVLKLAGFEQEPNECYFGPEWEVDGETFPFWAMRNASRTTWRQRDAISQLRRFPDRLRNASRARFQQRLASTARRLFGRSQ